MVKNVFVFIVVSYLDMSCLIFCFVYDVDWCFLSNINVYLKCCVYILKRIWSLNLEVGFYFDYLFYWDVVLW